ncbi:MAG: 16S rRNA (adenine(1518)-N(6)/adenine(1519)-N(6))-dimethyltransferase RsmA [Planctomycetota bacterium]|jgi:16S rRNA (adenine1518-N6/adenine1519-N6)-dimethyltransferase
MSSGIDPKRPAPPGGRGAWIHRKKALQALFQGHGSWPRKRLGQNFILDPNLLDFIAAAAEPGGADSVLEVGVGTGQLTGRLAERAGRVLGVEVDRLLFQKAQDALSGFEHVQLLLTDVLASKNRLHPDVIEAVRGMIPGPSGRLLHVSNLAYRIATPLLINLLESGLPFGKMVVTVQMEMAEKIVAGGPGDVGYGPVSLVVAFFAKARILRKVPRDVFWPMPKIQSAIVEIMPNPVEPEDGDLYPSYKALVRGLFTLRRKTLRRALETLGVPGRGEAVLTRAGIDPQIRPGMLTREDFLRLAPAFPAEGI